MANWKLIKSEYLRGATPRELAIKYKVKAKRISDVAYEQSWVVEKKKKQEEIATTREQQIDSLTTLALKTLQEIVDDPTTNKQTRVHAIRSILDISGLKRDNKNVDLSGDIEVVINQRAVKKED